MSFLVPSANQDDRLTRLESHVAYLAERLGVTSEELEAHSQPQIPQDVGQLLADGREVEAIRAYRDATGASLR